MLRRVVVRLAFGLLLAAAPACLGGPQTDPPGVQGFADYPDPTDSTHRTGARDGGMYGAPGDAGMTGIVGPAQDAGADAGSGQASFDANPQSPGKLPEGVRPLPREPLVRKTPPSSADADSFHTGVAR